MFTFVQLEDVGQVSPKMSAYLYSAVEALRLASHHLGILIDHFGERDIGERSIPDDMPEAVRDGVDMFVGILEQYVGPVPPAVSDRAFKILREWENRCERNTVGIEGVILCMSLAYFMLEDFQSASAEHSRDHTALDRAVNGIRESILVHGSSFDTVTVHSTALEGVVLSAILAGGPIPDEEEARRATIAAFIEEEGAAAG